MKELNWDKMTNEFHTKIKKLSRLIVDKLESKDFEIKFNNEIYIRHGDYIIKLGSTHAFEGYDLYYIFLFKNGDMKRIPIEYLPDEFLIYELFNIITANHNKERDRNREAEKKSDLLLYLKNFDV